MRERYEPLLRDDPCPRCGSPTEYDNTNEHITCTDCNQTAYVLGASPVRYYETDGQTHRITLLMRDARHQDLPASEELLIIETQEDDENWTQDTVLGEAVNAR